MLRLPGVVILKTMAHQGPISITMPGRLNLLSKVSSMTHRPMPGKTWYAAHKTGNPMVCYWISNLKVAIPHFVKLRWQQLNLRRSRNHQARQYMKCSKTRHWTSNRNRDVDCSDGQHPGTGCHGVLVVLCILVC